jgi:hypothetical protein
MGDRERSQARDICEPTRPETPEQRQRRIAAELDEDTLYGESDYARHVLREPSPEQLRDRADLDRADLDRKQAKEEGRRCPATFMSWPNGRVRCVLPAGHREGHR